MLHDLGRLDRSRVSGRLGFLADTTGVEGALPDPDALKAFLDETDCVAQPVTRWQGEDASFLVAFVPANKLADVGRIIEVLEKLVRSPPIPRT